jgi:peptide deformylase
MRRHVSDRLGFQPRTQHAVLSKKILHLNAVMGSMEGDRSLEPLEILTYPNNFLAKAVEPVTQIDGKLQKLIDHMAETMYLAPGVGLAAIQVNIDQSLLVYDIAPPEDGKDLHVLINPKIVASEGSIVSENEGCLSVPEFRADVPRAEQIFVEAVDREGRPIHLEAKGFLAIVLQHEIDHLNGHLFIDRISALKRQMYARRIKKKFKHES